MHRQPVAQAEFDQPYQGVGIRPPWSGPLSGIIQLTAREGGLIDDGDVAFTGWRKKGLGGRHTREDSEARADERHLCAARRKKPDCSSEHDGRRATTFSCELQLHDLVDRAIRYIAGRTTALRSVTLWPRSRPGASVTLTRILEPWWRTGRTSATFLSERASCVESAVDWDAWHPEVFESASSPRGSQIEELECFAPMPSSLRSQKSPVIQ